MGKRARRARRARRKSEAMARGGGRRKSFKKVVREQNIQECWKRAKR